MAITLCKRHGRAHFTEVCPHVAQCVDTGRYGAFHRIDMVPSGLLVCGDCLGKYGLVEFVNNPGLRIWDPDFDEATYQAYSEAYRRFEDRKIVCAECIAAAEVGQARSEGRPDPFQVYERTLTSHHGETILRLQTHLIENFQFRTLTCPLSTDAGDPAALVIAGDYRKPLTVTAYYVVEPLEQDEVVALVSDFLSGQRLDQAKVAFWEAEVWETGTTPENGARWARRGTENLLREVFLNC